MRVIRAVRCVSAAVTVVLGIAAVGEAQTLAPDPTQGEASFAEPPLAAPGAAAGAPPPPASAPPAPPGAPPAPPPLDPLTQQGAAEGSFPDPAAQQRDILREAVAAERIAPATNVKPPIEKGTMILRTVVLHPLPPRFAEVVPKYRQFGYFVLPDGGIAIVNPGPYQVAEIFGP